MYVGRGASRPRLSPNHQLQIRGSSCCFCCRNTERFFTCRCVRLDENFTQDQIGRMIREGWCHRSKQATDKGKDCSLEKCAWAHSNASREFWEYFTRKEQDSLTSQWPRSLCQVSSSSESWSVWSNPSPIRIISITLCWQQHQICGENFNCLLNSRRLRPIKRRNNRLLSVYRLVSASWRHLDGSAAFGVHYQVWFESGTSFIKVTICSLCEVTNKAWKRCKYIIIIDGDKTDKLQDCFGQFQ